jgi:Uma2 family endonuclease
MTLLAEAPPRVLSVEEFVALPDSIGYELIEGVLTERKPMGALSDYVATQFSRHLGNFAADRAAGHVFGAETTYHCFAHEATGRRADASFIGRGRLPGERIPEGTLDIPADVVIEVISPNDLATEVEEKVKLYLRHGFGEVWVVYPETRSMYVHRKGAPVLALEAGDTLTGRGALEGFACPVSQFFPPAPLDPALT